MLTKPALQRILRGTFQNKEKNKHIQETTGKEKQYQGSSSKGI